MSDTSDLLRAPQTPDGVTDWLAFEERYLQGRYAGADGIDAVRYVPASALPDQHEAGRDSRRAGHGTRPVLVTAPHAVTHWRDGVRKPVDMATGGLAEAVAARSGAAALTVTGRPLRDPNYDPDGAFKDALHVLLPDHGAVIDLHGMNDDWGPDICLALGAHPDRARDLRDLLEPALAGAGFTVAVNYPYQAAPVNTITSWTQAAGTPAIEIELARRVRRPWDEPDRGARLVSALTGVVVQLMAGDGPLARD